ncbi:protein of unknown function [Methanoculleus bourgensis]|jgi:hypothetical protein|uniref:Uncharacterized protein n=1 Tax=Methanoculleus bourgensis TaxID=83986 RepID=A0A0X3BJF2_9EURY|nr:protein of unknown function [Methanoculleus bourgensis]
MSEYVAPAIVELANGEGSTLACDNTCAICGGSCRLVAYLHGGIHSKHPACTNLGICINEENSEVKI